MSIAIVDANGYVVGGGVAIASLHAFTIASKDGAVANLTANDAGAFLVDAAAGVQATPSSVHFIPHLPLIPFATTIQSRTPAAFTTPARSDRGHRVIRTATVNCARYGPVYSLNFNCYVTQSGWGIFDTPGVAIRTNNHVHTDSSANTLYVCYTHGGSCDTSLANASCSSCTSTSTAGSSGNSVYSECGVSNVVGMECDTEWNT